MVTLKASVAPATVCTVRPVASTRPASSVAATRGPRVRVGQHLPEEALRRLHRPQVQARNRRDDVPVEVDALDGVRDRHHRHDRVGAGAQGRDDALHHVDRHERPRGVVHQHPAHLGGQGREARRDAVLPLRSPLDDADAVRREQCLDLGGLAWGGGHDDRADRRARAQAPDGMDQQGFSGEQAQRLGRSGSEAGARPGGGDDHSHLSRARHGPVVGAGPGVRRRCGRGAGGSPASRPNTRRPFAVVTTLVTCTSASAPTCCRAFSTTTMDPSSR